MKRAVNSYLTQRRRSPAAFTLIELILSMLILSIALLPLVGVLPNNAIQQIQNDRKERAILTANAAADNLTALFPGRKRLTEP